MNKYKIQIKNLHIGEVDEVERDLFFNFLKPNFVFWSIQKFKLGGIRNGMVNIIGEGVDRKVNWIYDGAVSPISSIVITAECFGLIDFKLLESLGYSYSVEKI